MRHLAFPTGANISSPHTYAFSSKKDAMLVVFDITFRHPEHLYEGSSGERFLLVFNGTYFISYFDGYTAGAHIRLMNEKINIYGVTKSHWANCIGFNLTNITVV